MTTRSDIPFTVPRCTVCGRLRGPKHLETCTGPPQRLAPPPEPRTDEDCDCPGGFHQPGCPVAWWPGDAA